MRKLQLILVSFRTPEDEVRQLQACLAQLGPEIGYAVVVNEHRPGDPVEALAPGADLFVSESGNLGYGRAVNRAARQLDAPWLAALNTDLSWAAGCFEILLQWLEQHPEVVLAVPQIRDPSGEVQALCKTDPSVWALFSRRFLPRWFKPPGLRAYDRRFQMGDADLSQVLDVPYLSGCCMVMRRWAFERVGGFDERFFLYLEDADLSRSLRALGRCVHLPVAAVCHAWGRGNHRSWWLTLVNLHSAWLYFNKWGWRWF